MPRQPSEIVRVQDGSFQTGKVNDNFDVVKDILIRLLTATGEIGGFAFLVGSVDPDNENGSDNDVYLRTSNLNLFKKVAGAWGVVANLGDALTLEGHPASDFSLANHNHDTRYYTEAEVAQLLAGKADLVGGTIPANQIPGSYDDIIEFANVAAFPAEGNPGKLYVDLSTKLHYRWSGTIYVNTDTSLALGETALTAYRGDRGKVAYDHSQTNGNPHNTTADDVGAPSINQFNVAITSLQNADTGLNQRLQEVEEALDDLPSSSLGMVLNAPLTGNIDGTNTDFSLASAAVDDNVQLLWNNAIYTPGAAFSVSGQDVAFADAPLPGDVLLASYIPVA